MIIVNLPRRPSDPVAPLELPTGTEISGIGAYVPLTASEPRPKSAMGKFFSMGSSKDVTASNSSTHSSTGSSYSAPLPVPKAKALPLPTAGGLYELHNFISFVTRASSVVSKCSTIHALISLRHNVTQIHNYCHLNSIRW